MTSEVKGIFKWMQMGFKEYSDSDDTDYDGATLYMRLPDMLIRHLIIT